jgi:hypothetical protein
MAGFPPVQTTVLTLTKSLRTRNSLGLYYAMSFMFYTSDNESMNNITMQMHLDTDNIYSVKTSKNYDASLVVSTAYTQRVSQNSVLSADRV